MDSFEISGKTIEDAIQNAMQRLGVSREQIKYTILKEGKSGILGIGSEEACILVEPIAPQAVIDDITHLAKGILEELVKRMGFEAEVSLTESLIIEDNESAPAITFNITGDDNIGILIGRHGQTMASLQYIVRVLVARKVENPPSIIIDVDGYKQRRYKSLRSTAKRLAEQVKMRKTPFTLEPMPAFERRIIHLTLANDAYVTTQSIGEGELRKVVIVPKSMGKSTRNNR